MAAQTLTFGSDAVMSRHMALLMALFVVLFLLGIAAHAAVA
jgi:hypothetical protein